MNETYSVVVPVYNGSRTVGELTAGLVTLFEGTGVDFEIILVDDLSNDNSWEVMTKLVQTDSRIKAIRLAANFGQHNATICGMNHSKGDYIITMDDDLQHAPQDIPRLIVKMRESLAEVVIAKLTQKKHSFYRRVASNIIGKVAELFIKKPRGLHLSSFRLVKRRVVEEMLVIKHPRPYVPALIFRVTDKVVNVEIGHKARKYGSSNYSLKRMLRLAGHLIMNNSVLVKFLDTSKPAYVIDKREERA